MSFNKSQSLIENITEDPKKPIDNTLSPIQCGWRITWSTLMDAGKNAESEKSRSAKIRQSRSRVYSLDNQCLITQLFKRGTEPDHDLFNERCGITDREIDDQDPNV